MDNDTNLKINEANGMKYKWEENGQYYGGDYPEKDEDAAEPDMTDDDTTM
jgi:hypothetical protein